MASVEGRGRSTSSGGSSVGRLRGIERQPRALEGSGALEIAFEFLSEPLPSERLHEELQAIALLVLVVTQPMEHADDRFGHDEHVGGRKELVEHLAGTRQRGGAPRDGHEKPALLESVGGVPILARHPMSLIAVAMWSSGQPSNAILNLRGRLELRGCRSR